MAVGSVATVVVVGIAFLSYLNLRRSPIDETASPPAVKRGAEAKPTSNITRFKLWKRVLATTRRFTWRLWTWSVGLRKRKDIYQYEAKGKYCFLRVNVRNDGDVATGAPSETSELSVGNHRFPGYSGDGPAFYETLFPGEQESGLIVFDFPIEATPSALTLGFNFQDPPAIYEVVPAAG